MILCTINYVNKMNRIPYELEYYIISKFLGERDSLSRMKCVSKKFNYISYHKSNHARCKNCEWFVKNFPKEHLCDTSNCMIIKNMKYKTTHKCKIINTIK